ncbi:hypothetical protein [Nocardioides speluncae]|uniref:hypothetical protein n=1 Tax=Nocardioides speluncae TaxID=2670337 RepID=UPI000D68821A|nr:hypothetical protein [Nocardioides speluncae]
MNTEERLTEALDSLAGQVGSSAGAFPRVQAEWRRRERRRRLVGAVLAVVVVATSNGVALWALGDGSADTHIVDRSPGQP